MAEPNPSEEQAAAHEGAAEVADRLAQPQVPVAPPSVAEEAARGAAQGAAEGAAGAPRARGAAAREDTKVPQRGDVK